MRDGGDGLGFRHDAIVVTFLGFFDVAKRPPRGCAVEGSEPLGPNPYWIGIGSLCYWPAHLPIGRASPVALRVYCPVVGGKQACVRHIFAFKS